MADSKREIQRKMVFEVEPTPQELAEVFWSMDDSDQAAFFNHLEYISEGMLGMQLQGVIENESLSIGRAAMVTIGEYGEAEQ